MKRTELKCYALVTGIKNRCRKVSREIIKLGYYPLGTTIESVKENAIKSVNASMKTIEFATIHLDLVEIEKCNGYDSETWAMFDSRHVKAVLIERGSHG